VYNNQGGGIMSRAILAMLCACVVMIATKGVTQVVLAFGAGGLHKLDSHTCRAAECRPLLERVERLNRPRLTL
jgi:hypothetical protein